MQLDSIYSFECIDFSANGLHVVETIEHRMGVDAHPCKKSLDFLMLVDDVAGVNDGDVTLETDGLVMGNAISEAVHLV